MRHPTVIFAIDEQTHEEHEDFLWWLSNDCGLGPNQYKQLFGCYQGEQETSFLIAQDLFDKHIRGTLWIAQQESVLHVTGCNKAYAVLEFLADGKRLGLGSMMAVPEHVAREREAWTYRPDTNTWFICDHSNPDHAKELT